MYIYNVYLLFTTILLQLCVQYFDFTSSYQKSNIFVVTNYFVIICLNNYLRETSICLKTYSNFYY